MIPGGKTTTEWHGEEVTRKRLTTTALNRGNRRRCGKMPGGKTTTEWHGKGVTRKRLTTTALNRGNRCHCGMRPDRKTVTEWSVEGTTRRWLTTTALNRRNRCRCGKRKRPAATKRRPIGQKAYLCKIMKQPLNNSSRIESVDALRGFAVMAILSTRCIRRTHRHGSLRLTG